MGVRKQPKNVMLAYFSGTGCTKAVCDSFEEKWSKLGINNQKIDMSVHKHADLEQTDLLMIFSPVYACNLTIITEEWVKNLQDTKKKAAVIISVSGGGEVSPNTACREKCKKLLQKKGYTIIYEKMIVMPSNFAIQAQQELNRELLRVLPNKVDQVISDILSGRKHLTKPKLQDRFFALIGHGERFGAGCFGAMIRVSGACNHCGLCARKCPKRNIQIKNNIPKFGFRCMWCLKCIYFCPQKALSPGLLKFTVLKDGFDLNQMNKEALEEQNEKKRKIHKNVLWQGVIDYLNEDK